MHHCTIRALSQHEHVDITDAKRGEVGVETLPNGLGGRARRRSPFPVRFDLRAEEDRLASNGWQHTSNTVALDTRVELDMRDSGSNRVPEGKLSAVDAHAGRVERERRKGHSAREAPSWDASSCCQCSRARCSRQRCRANTEQRRAAVAARSELLEAGHGRQCGKEQPVNQMHGYP